MSKKTTMSQSAQIKQFITRLLLFAACFILVDLLLPHITLPNAADRFYVVHKTLGWMGKPGFTGTLDGPEFRQEISFNSLGMHDTEHAQAKPPHTRRVLMLGDSFVQAVHVAEAETAHQLLENELNRQHPDQNFEVISGGVINWGTNQQLVFYREIGRQFEPDLVLVMFSLSTDLQDNLPGNVLTTQSINAYAPYFTMCQNRLNPAPLTYAPGISQLDHNCHPARRALINLMGKFYQNSLLYQQLERGILSQQPRQTFGQDYPLPYAALYLPHQEPALAQAWQVTLATLHQLRQEVEADGHQFGVAIITPSLVVRLMLLSPAEREQFIADNPTFAAVQPDRPNRRLAQFFAQQGIHAIDLTQPLVEQWATHGTELYFLENGHWTVEGNRVVGVTLAHWISQNGLLRAGAK